MGSVADMSRALRVIKEVEAYSATTKIPHDYSALRELDAVEAPEEKARIIEEASLQR